MELPHRIGQIEGGWMSDRCTIPTLFELDQHVIFQRGIAY